MDVLGVGGVERRGGAEDFLSVEEDQEEIGGGTVREEDSRSRV